MPPNSTYYQFDNFPAPFSWQTWSDARKLWWIYANVQADFSRVMIFWSKKWVVVGW
jgi:hypothetical protein